MIIFAFFNETRFEIHKLQAPQFAVNAVPNSYFTFKLINNFMKFGSTYFRLTEFDSVFTHLTNSHGLHLSESGKGRWRCCAQCSYRDLCTSYRFTDTTHTTTCGAKDRGPVCNFLNSYFKVSVFTSL